MSLKIVVTLLLCLTAVSRPASADDANSDSRSPGVEPVDRGAIVEAAINSRIAAGETMPERLEDPGYAVASCKATQLSASGWINDGFRAYICENTTAGQAIVRWRAWYCENDRKCVLGEWPGGRYPANTESLEYTIRSNLGTVAGMAGQVLVEFRPPTWKALPQELPAPNQSPEDTYEAAFELLKAEEYHPAARAFEQFLVANPVSDYADNAQYWLAESHYATNQFSEALRQFQIVIGKYPDSRKIPDALLKAGYCNYELQHWDDARELLERLMTDFPETTAARLGSQRLRRMDAEGS